MAPRLLPLLLLGCAGAPEPGQSHPIEPMDDSGMDESTEPPAWCEGPTAHRWDPSSTEDLDLFPDGLLLREDSSSPTGLRVDLTVESAPWLANVPPVLQQGFSTFGDLSGFGTLGGALLRFTAPVTDLPANAEASVSNPGWQLLDLDTEPPERVPFEASLLEDGHTVVLWPLRPLRRGHAHALLVTTDARAADGGCIAPTETTRALLDGQPEDPRIAATAPRYRQALDHLGLSPDAVSVLSVFPTQDDLGPMQRVAASIPTQETGWEGPASCEPFEGAIRCEARFQLRDHRDANGLVDDTVEPTQASIPVSIYLPEGEGPWPVVIYGHGLGGHRSEAWTVASLVGLEGFAIVSMEAVEHGEHPSVGAEGPGDAALRFLGLDIAALSIDVRALRGNFDQTVIDRLQLLHLVQQEPDLDGDGQPELDPSRIAYLGVSLGGLLGPGMLALSPDIEAGVLSVGGGRLMSIVTESEAIETYGDLVVALVGSRERFDRLVPVVQHLVDPSDPAVWGASVLENRLVEGPPPSVLLQVGLSDEVVPPASGFALARALDLPHMAPVAEPVPLLTVVEADPVTGNLDDGATTAALFQFDRVTRDGSVRPAYHVDTPTSDEGTLQVRHFIQTWLMGGPPEVLDPYAALGTPPLGE